MMSDLVLPVSMWTERENIVDCHLVWGIFSRPMLRRAGRRGAAG